MYNAFNSSFNFETGILTNDPKIVEQAMNQFDEVWIGNKCQGSVPQAIICALEAKDFEDAVRNAYGGEIC